MQLALSGKAEYRNDEVQLSSLAQMCLAKRKCCYIMSWHRLAVQRSKNSKCIRHHPTVLTLQFSELSELFEIICLPRNVWVCCLRLCLWNESGAHKLTCRTLAGALLCPPNILKGCAAFVSMFSCQRLLNVLESSAKCPRIEATKILS